MTKPLQPTLRERNRYIVFELRSEGKLDRKQVTKSLWNTVLRFLGELGASETSLWLIDWLPDKQKGILKVNHKSVTPVQAALALLKEVDKKPVLPRVLGVSGTIKKAREKWMD